MTIRWFQGMIESTERTEAGALTSKYREVLETFTGDKEGNGKAWEATAKYAGVLVNHCAVDRLAVGVRQVRNEIGQWEWAVVLVQRES